MRLYSSLLIAASVLASPAQALIIITPEQSASPAENIQFNDGAPVNVNPLTAFTNIGTQVTLTGNENLVPQASGQARISGSDGSINYLEIQLADVNKFMSAVEFALTDPNGRWHTTATITAYDQSGTSAGSQTFTLGQGLDWFSIVATDFDLISRVVIETADPIEDIRQIRLTSVTGDTPAVPEPATWAMMILGFGLVGTAQRHRRPVKA